jgi:hypothetical protein
MGKFQNESIIKTHVLNLISTNKEQILKGMAQWREPPRLKKQLIFHFSMLAQAGKGSSLPQIFSDGPRYGTTITCEQLKLTGWLSVGGRWHLI